MLLRLLVDWDSLETDRMSFSNWRLRVLTTAFALATVPAVATAQNVDPALLEPELDAKNVPLEVEPYADPEILK